MSVMTKWRNKSFEISSETVKAIEDIKWSYEQVADNNNDAEGTPETNERGLELFPLSFSTTLHGNAGVDVRTEIKSWGELVTKTGYFYLAGKLLGPLLQLRKVSVSNVKLDNFGRMRLAKLTFTFKEYDRASTSVVDTSALRIGASTSEKSEYKPTTVAYLMILGGSSSAQTITVGATVMIVGSKYYGGQSIPEWVLQRTHVVSQISGDRALLGANGGIYSWVYLSDLSLA